MRSGYDLIAPSWLTHTAFQCFDRLHRRPAELRNILMTCSYNRRMQMLSDDEDCLIVIVVKETPSHSVLEGKRTE